MEVVSDVRVDSAHGYASIVVDIERVAAACRSTGQFVEYDSRLPTVLVHRGKDDEFFFQEHEAQVWVDEFEACEGLSDYVEFEDWLLWGAQGW